MWSTAKSQRQEHGAVAVMVAVLALVILGVGALAIDMGQAYAKRSALQSNVDMAVMAAAAHLDNPGACNPEVVSAAESYLLKAGNMVKDQIPLDLGGAPTDDDGYIECDDWKVELWAPRVHVEFGLAKALADTNDGVNVPAHAAAAIKSPAGSAGLPMYGVSGCDYGSQTLRDDSGPAGPVTPPVPPLTPTSATFNSADFTIAPDSAPAGSTSLTVVLEATDGSLAGADAVGFTGAGGPPDHHEVTAADLTIAPDGNSITLDVPPAVLAIEDVWFVRVLKGPEWSNEEDAQRFTVGDPRLYCASSVEGNFGTLNIPRTDTSFELEWNIIRGPQLTLAIHPSPGGECGGDPPPTVESVHSPIDGTNCVETEPGLKIAQTNDGLVKGKGGELGRLDHDTTPGCSRTGADGRTPTAIGGKYLNDDLLTCFIINNARISDLVAGNATGTNALSADIFKSPRYFWIPILDVEPYTGTKSWPVVGFRPGFITDQALSATNSSPGIVGEFNGIEAEPSGLRALEVILFDETALPETAPALGGEIDYTGSGPKVIVLVE